MKDRKPYQTYIDALRRQVCAVCLDGRGDGSCGLTRRRCALDAHLPRVLEAIADVKSNRMHDYVEAIESEVCSSCDQLGHDGGCRLRSLGECALATYLSLVVDAVEEARQM